MNSATNNVFGNEDLRKLILSYYIPKRCLSCKKILLDPKITKPKKYKDYNNYKWRETENKYMKIVCNWCYYYVYEYP
jgi:hypothetical protein